MKKRPLYIIIVCAILSLHCTLMAQEEDFSQVVQTPLADKTAVARLAGGMEARISLDLRNIEVVDALKFLALKAGLNIVATKNVAGRVTLMVENVQVQDIFDIMLRSNGLAYAKENDIYNVMTEDEYKGLFGRKFADIREVKVFRLRYAIPEQAFSLLDTLKSDIGRVLVEPDSGTALIMDTPDKIKEIEQALAMLEEKNEVKVFVLKYAKAKDVEEQLKSQLDVKKVGTVKSDERSNQLIIQALPDRMEGIKELIQALDKKTKEVLIDTKIVKVKLSDQQTKGLEWEGLMGWGRNYGMSYLGSYPFSVIQSATDDFMTRYQYLTAKDKMKGQAGAYPFSGNTSSQSASTKTTPGEEMHIGIISGKADMDFIIKYLNTLGNTQILSNPKLAVINNQEARIHVGERQAYVTTTTTTGQTTTTVSEEVTFVDVGIQLSVTPNINDDGYVTMKIKPEVSSVVSTLITPTGNEIPIIDTSMAETTVLIKDGSTIIIGGLRKEEKISNAERVPALSSIPLLGNLFKSSTAKTERTELLVMITPYIVEGDELTTGDEKYFKGESPKDSEKYHSFTEGTDYIDPQEKPEDKIKEYRDYSSYQEEDKEPQLVTIKGAEAYE